MVVVEARETRSGTVRPNGPADGNVLIEEARRRHRRRQLRIAVAALAVGALAAELIVAFAPSGGRTARISTGAPQFSNYVAAATRKAGTADVSIVLGSTVPPGFPGCQIQATTGTGTIDFRTNSIGLRLLHHGVGLCGSPFLIQMRQLGSVLYATDPSTRHVLTSPGRPWLKSPATSPEVVPGFGNGGIRAGTTASFLFTALDSLRTPVTPMGTITLNGTKVSGYRGTVTLADLQTASQAQARATGASFENLEPPAGSIPPAAGLPISVAFWIDSHGRVRQFSATEALYALNYADGSGAIGPQIYPSEYLGRHGNSAVHEQGAIELTLNLTNFGTPDTISPPPPSQVTTGRVG